MRRLLVAALLGFTACATATWDRVKDAHTIAQARAELRGFEPGVTRYAPNIEAWYFDASHCVLFVDGVVRYSSNASAWSDGPRQPKQPSVLCAPSMLEH